MQWWVPSLPSSGGTVTSWCQDTGPVLSTCRFKDQSYQQVSPCHYWSSEMFWQSGFNFFCVYLFIISSFKFYLKDYFLGFYEVKCASKIVQLPVWILVKGVSGVHRPVSLTWAGAEGACDCFLTEPDSLKDLLSSSHVYRNAWYPIGPLLVGM